MGDDTDKESKLVLKGKILGNLEMLVKRAVKAEGENKLLVKNEGKLEVKKVRYFLIFFFNRYQTKK